MREDHHAECGSCPLHEVTVVPDAIPGMDRRLFVSRAVAAAAAALLAACGGAEAVTGTLSNKLVLSLSQYPTLASVGGVATVTSGGARLAVVRTATSTFVALSLACPHEGATVNPSSGGFTCSRHGARFDSNGTWTGGQRTSGLRSYPTAYDATAGTVTIG